MQNLRVFFLFFNGFLFLASVSFAQTTETLEISTYYPAPYGSYSELQLHPKDSPSACNANTRGTMYYDASDNQVMVCKDVGKGVYAWVILGNSGVSKQLFTSDDTFIVPQGVTTVFISMSGGGGGGGGAQSFMAVPVNVTPGNINITIGAGGWWLS